MRKGIVSPLLERDGELTVLAALVQAAADAAGAVVVIKGVAGIGKSELLSATREFARARGLRVLAARGGELEQGFAFGVVRQLLEPPVMAAGDDERAALFAGAARLAAAVVGVEDPSQGAGASGEDFATAHALYWLCANLSAQAPMVICVDDVHWADAPSLRFLAYLARRVEALAILVVVAIRSEGAMSESVARVFSEPGTRFLRPRALSPAAVAHLLASSFDSEVAPAFADALYAATGGNPFLITEVVRALRQAGIEGNDAQIGAIEQLGPSAVSGAVVRRLQRLPGRARDLGRAVAVLGATAELRQAAGLAGLSMVDAARAADDLVAMEILKPTRPLEFVHPIVRAAIHGDLAPGERGLLHRRAAEILASDAAPAEAIASHLLATDPAGDPWVAGALRRAAGVALARGAADSAVTYLRRALAEPPPDRPLLLYELGAAERRLDTASAVEHLRNAFKGLDDARARALTALELVRALFFAGRSAEAVEFVDVARAGLGPGDEELSLQLEAALISALRIGAATSAMADRRLKALRGRVTGATAAERLLLVNLATQVSLGQAAGSEVADLAEQALARGQLLAEQSSAAIEFYMAVWLLMCADRFELAERALEEAVADARARGSLVGFAMASAFRSHLGYALGQLAQAEAEARNAAGLLHAWPLGRPVTTFALVDALVERGDLTEAEAELGRHGLDQELPDSVPHRLLLASRGQLRLAQGRTRESLSDFRELMAREERSGVANPFLGSYRAVAALALRDLGDQNEACRMVDDEVERARHWGTPRRLGLALRLGGVVHGGERGQHLLHEAVDVLQQSPARLARAVALTELGSSLRRTGQRSEAVGLLRRGLELAHACGATGLSERARQELIVAGARPRRPALSGLEALTPSERRVARLAASGLSNRDIAQALFVTVRTVELHLSHAYQKLGIARRKELPASLTASCDSG